jgi:hypothetical protein
LRRIVHVVARNTTPFLHGYISLGLFDHLLAGHHGGNVLIENKT